MGTMMISVMLTNKRHLVVMYTMMIWGWKEPLAYMHAKVVYGDAALQNSSVLKTTLHVTGEGGEMWPFFPTWIKVSVQSGTRMQTAHIMTQKVHVMTSASCPAPVRVLMQETSLWVTHK